ncbi:unnamed protein product (macronuclear) [Paramecium tetraurelia]|uniref:Uncharacterized protein n=1 Tax=Paramecium tetraurelia TaxID=5888 RepID=A0DBL8_PARTE|nr:uncharacterized protein GSPATT00015331001 [Paramecium tetraurelia]CAK80435.1 unnamed protein product [Paramecium tetraurelia]|eukprot:XP_001447832.1 hypothetical protein (macronuclear) [Paramecium tetraurelia strain d4-2]
MNICEVGNFSFLFNSTRQVQSFNLLVPNSQYTYKCPNKKQLLDLEVISKGRNCHLLEVIQLTLKPKYQLQSKITQLIERLMSRQKNGVNKEEQQFQSYFEHLGGIDIKE